MDSHWPASVNHPPLSSDEAHVWAVPLDRMGPTLDLLARTLSPEECQRADEFRLAAPRQRFVAARSALRVLLGQYLETSPLDVPIIFDSNKKPRLAEAHFATDLRFNVAHSDRLALIAVTVGREIGVDVERLREVRHAEHIARRFFHPAEIAAIAAAPASDRNATFLRIWTGKEAVLKAIGAGITGSLSAFQIPDAEDAAAGVMIDVPTLSRREACWMRRLNPDDDYSAAVAVVGPKPNIRCMTFIM